MKKGKKEILKKPKKVGGKYSFSMNTSKVQSQSVIMGHSQSVTNISASKGSFEQHTGLSK
jgi:hypothetical protein